jgi:DNA sulfur modification protein DndE
MAIETVRISKKGRSQLIRLKRNTGIDQWNILCRWALCLSLSDPSIPPVTIDKEEQGVEINWRTFGGKLSDLYLGLLKARCLQDNLKCTDPVLSEQLRLHIHRGLGRLLDDKDLRSIEALIKYIPQKQALAISAN